MKGTMSELELSLFRQRSQEALKQKASRGALILGVAAGYVKVGRDRIEKNPDQRVREALQLVFSKFAEFQSARQVHIWLRDEGIELPVKSRDGEAYGIVWRLPAYNIGSPAKTVGGPGLLAALRIASKPPVNYR
jgi:DNA invertase Pin-like site-specific DNA recombinase